MRRLSFIAKDQDITYINAILKHLMNEFWTDQSLSDAIRYCIRYTYNNLVTDLMSNKSDTN